MVIRSVTGRDYAAVKHLIEQTENTVLQEESFRAAFYAQLDDPCFHAFVCENGGTVLAFINLRIDYRLRLAAKAAEIMELAAEEDCQGQGISRELFRHACQFAREEGCVQMEWNSPLLQEAEHRFCEAGGMRRDRSGYVLPLDEKRRNHPSSAF